MKTIEDNEIFRLIFPVNDPSNSFGLQFFRFRAAQSVASSMENERGSLPPFRHNCIEQGAV
jgi:hypothetical protein